MKLTKGVLSLTLAVALTAPASATHNGEVPPPGCRWIRGTDTPEDHSDDVFVCREDAWIHHGGTRLGNLAALGQAGLPTWDTTPPATSLRDGGGLWFTNSVTRQSSLHEDARGSFVARGGYTGVLDNVAFDLYAYVTPLSSQDLNIELAIDDQLLFVGSVADVRNEGSDSLRRLRFAFTDLYDALDEWWIPNTASTQHSLRVSVGGAYVVNDAMVFAYDATDAPAGVIFNHEAPSGAYTTIGIETSGPEG